MTPKKSFFTNDKSGLPGEERIISVQTGLPVSSDILWADLDTVQVIYVGEKHRYAAHHRVQLKVIKELFKRYPELSIGMEMFDRSYQHVLNLWSSGKLDQEIFLKKTHWYANWKFDFELYHDILNFIKEKNIPLVGLNIPFHIPPKIAVGGIDSLMDDDRKYIPEKINVSDTDHRAYVQEVFTHHPHIRGRDNFENFYVAQCVWDDAMAESVALNLKENKMVVLAGIGHVQKFGIPDRVLDRTGSDFRIILPTSSTTESEHPAADYLWITPPNKKRHSSPDD
ncbi:ChaN family lipoprotein [Desulfonema magnum]|nr:ChaN family lipoprotein [Desulfonema magnum]